MARPEERIDLANVIKSMGKLPADKQKILVLEAAQVPSNWRLGMLHNDFARRLDELEPEIRKVPNLWVYSAAGVDQRCWSSEGLGQTVFGHYLIEALRGQATRDDSRLTLGAIDLYVSRSVKNWVWSAEVPSSSLSSCPRGRRSAERNPSRQEHRRTSRQSTSGRANRGATKSPGRPIESSWRQFPLHLPQALENLPIRTCGQPGRHSVLSTLLTPHPSTYSPRRWREYRALLLRYDELVRAGASTATSDPVMRRIVATERVWSEVVSWGRLSPRPRTIWRCTAWKGLRAIPELPPIVHRFLDPVAGLGGRQDLEEAAGLIKRAA